MLLIKAQERRAALLGLNPPIGHAVRVVQHAPEHREMSTDKIEKALAGPRRARRPRVSGPRHMLRHACGYALAAAGHDTRRIQDWLGHRSIQHTTRYTQLSAAPIRDFWR